MSEIADLTLTCRQCGKQFVFTWGEQEFYERKGFTFPSRCLECRSAKQNKSQHLICSQCRAELNKGVPVYCSACLASACLEFELKFQECQRLTDDTQSKLLAAESQGVELIESVRQKEQLVAELEQKVSNLSQELEKAHQVRVEPEWLQAALNDIKGRLETLEHAQHQSNRVVLEEIQAMHDKHRSTSLVEGIRHRLRCWNHKVPAK